MGRPQLTRDLPAYVTPSHQDVEIKLTKREGTIGHDAYDVHFGRWIIGKLIVWPEHDGQCRFFGREGLFDRTELLMCHDYPSVDAFLASGGEAI